MTPRGGTRRRGRLLVVEDKESLRRLLVTALSHEGYEVASAEDVKGACAQLASGSFAAVLSDLKLPDGTGIEVLAAARAAQPAAPVIMLTGFGTVATAVEAMKQGAYDFLEKPVELDDLARLLERALGTEEGAALGAIPTFAPYGTPPIIGRHPRLRAALRLLERVAPTESTVLLTGESGTGKELFARALHALSPRRAGPFVAVNCAAIPETLIENELFGHERGAFTGADRRQSGRFELAAEGTLFLDEIGELGAAVQGKVLRVLEERSFERVGGGASLRADIRLVAATNRDLEGMVAAGSFRSDLYFRLAVFPLSLPPLRERASDVPLLARHLLERLAERLHREPLALSPDALQLLAEEPWPGNVRELSNVLERAAILTTHSTLRAADLRAATRPQSGERERLERALVAAGGNKQRAAEALGVSYRTLQRKVQEFDLEGVPKYRD